MPPPPPVARPPRCLLPRRQATRGSRRGASVRGSRVSGLSKHGLGGRPPPLCPVPLRARISHPAALLTSLPLTGDRCTDATLRARIQPLDGHGVGDLGRYKRSGGGHSRLRFSGVNVGTGMPGARDCPENAETLPPRVPPAHVPATRGHAGAFSATALPMPARWCPGLQFAFYPDQCRSEPAHMLICICK